MRKLEQYRAPLAEAAEMETLGVLCDSVFYGDAGDAGGIDDNNYVDGGSF